MTDQELMTCYYWLMLRGDISWRQFLEIPSDYIEELWAKIKENREFDS